MLVSFKQSRISEGFFFPYCHLCKLDCVITSGIPVYKIFPFRDFFELQILNSSLLCIRFVLKNHRVFLFVNACPKILWDLEEVARAAY
jgi:hypothetical protein